MFHASRRLQDQKVERRNNSFIADSPVYRAEMTGDMTNFDLPAGQWSVCHCFQVHVCRSLAALQRQLALQSRHIQKGGQNKLGLIQNPLPIHKLDKR